VYITFMPILAIVTVSSLTGHWLYRVTASSSRVLRSVSVIIIIIVIPHLEMRACDLSKSRHVASINLASALRTHYCLHELFV